MIYQKEKAFTYKSEHNENQYKGFKGSPLQVGKLDWLRGNLLNIKTKKTVDCNSNIKSNNSIDGFQYTGGQLTFFLPIAIGTEGYVKVTAISAGRGLPTSDFAFNYVFNYTDHLGNVRLSYSKDPQTGTLEILDEDHYYPFGLKHGVYATGGQKGFRLDETGTNGGIGGIGDVELINILKTDYNYKYNGQEWQDELGLNWYNYRYRNYDPTIGRFMGIDPISEDYYNISTYQFAHNNPVWKIEIEGLEGVETAGKDRASDIGNNKAAQERKAHSSVPNWLAFRSGAPHKWSNSARVVAGNFATRGASKTAKESVLRKDGPVQTEDGKDRGSKQGAYRHALWQAFVTQEFSRSDAKLVRDAHEGGAVDVSQTKNLGSIFQADQVADEFNNRIGRNYGAGNKDQSWKEMALGVLDVFKEEGLYTITQNEDGSFNVQRTKLTEKEYNQLRDRYENLNNSGRDKEDNKEIRRFGE